MDLIEINNLHVQTEIGFSPHEHGNLQELIITIQLKIPKKAGYTDCVEGTIGLQTVAKEVFFHVENKKYNLIEAGYTDCVEGTIGLQTVAKEVFFHVENKKYNLIEAVATDIARICVVRHGVQWVRVEVKKPNALHFSDYSSVTVERCLGDFEWNDVHVSIGSNINPFENIPKALDLLKEKVEIIDMSRAFRTTAVGFKQQDDFVNMAIVLKTKLGPEGLKMFFTRVEQQLGRIRDATNKSAPITIDLDISFWGDSVLEYKMLRVSKTQSWSFPDPDILKHAHVIIPLADVTPDFIHPLRKQPLRMIAEDVCGAKEFASFFPIVQIKESVKSKNANVRRDAVQRSIQEYRPFEHAVKQRFPPKRIKMAIYFYKEIA